MLQSPGRFAIEWLMLAGAIVALGGSESLACSGPRAARTIRESEFIGSFLAGVSIAIVAGGCRLLRRRDPGRRIRWIVAPLAIHPRWWMDAFHGDCGYGLRFWSLVATVWIAVAVALAVCWPRLAAAEAEPKKWRWTLSGALAGALVGVPAAALILQGPGLMSANDLRLAGATLWSLVIAGILVGEGLFRIRTRAARRFTFSLRTLLLLPIVLAPLFVVLFPVLPYEAAVPRNFPVRWVAVDDVTGQPIPNVSVQLIDLRIAEDNLENQPSTDIPGDGRPGLITGLYATIRGRQGLLGRTGTITYNPLMIRIVAPGYRPFFTSIAGDLPIPRDQLTAPPLGLTIPPPPLVTVRLRSSTGAGANGQSGRHPSLP